MSKILNRAGEQVGRRVRRIEVSPDVLPMMFTKGLRTEVIEGIPKDANFKGYTIDPQRNILLAFIEHPSFEMCPWGDVPPLQELSFKNLPLLELSSGI